MRSGATSRSTRSSTTSPRFRSSTTSAASTICAPASCDRSAIRRSASAKIRCGCCARSRWRRGSTSRSIRRSSTRSAPTATRSPAARRRGCSRSTTRFCARGSRRADIPRPGGARAARADLRGAAPRRRRAALAIARRARRVPPPVRIDAGHAHQRDPARQPARPAWACLGHRGQTASTSAERTTGRQRPPGPRLGELPLARRDVERLRQILGLQRRLRDLDASPRAKRALTHRSIFREALTWLEIHGARPEVVEHWKAASGGDRRDRSPAQMVAAGRAAPLQRADGDAGEASAARRSKALPPRSRQPNGDHGSRARSRVLRLLSVSSRGSALYLNAMR